MSRSLAGAALALLSLALPASADAQTRYRSTTGRGRMELSFDHGYGFGTEGEFAELATDLRLYAPFGFGAVLRAGLATRLLSNAVAFDLGVAQRFNLLAGDWAGLQLGVAVGASYANGPFDAQSAGSTPFGDCSVDAYGGFAMVHLDVWIDTMFFGVGVTGHALWPGAHGPSTDPILTITPTLRVGGDWGL